MLFRSGARLELLEEQAPARPEDDRVHGPCIPGGAPQPARAEPAAASRASPEPAPRAAPSPASWESPGLASPEVAPGPAAPGSPGPASAPDGPATPGSPASSALSGSGVGLGDVAVSGATPPASPTPSGSGVSPGDSGSLPSSPASCPTSTPQPVAPRHRTRSQTGVFQPKIRTDGTVAWLAACMAHAAADPTAEPRHFQAALGIPH